LKDVLIVSATRLPSGKFGGALVEVSDLDLGTTVIAETLKRAGLEGMKFTRSSWPMVLERAIFHLILPGL